MPLTEQGHKILLDAYQSVGSRRFYLQRTKDISGMSGEGRVAEGVEFPDGTAVMRWNGDTASTAVYRDIYDLERIHGHEGSTEVVWVDES